jgi:hypothetical protein
MICLNPTYHSPVVVSISTLSLTCLCSKQQQHNQLEDSLTPTPSSGDPQHRSGYNPLQHPLTLHRQGAFLLHCHFTRPSLALYPESKISFEFLFIQVFIKT